MQIKEEQFNNKEPQLKKSVAEFLNAYMQPSFGSMSKRDVDIKLFCFMQDLGLISPNPSIYEVMRALNITRSKARNLIYEAEIRKELNFDQLDDMLRQKIAHPMFGKIGDKISIEIDNPLLIDHLRDRLKKIGHLTDGSFHAEVVTMSCDAFSDLYADLLSEANQNAIHSKFVALGLEQEKGVKPFLKNALKCVAHAALGKAGEGLVSSAQEIIGDWISGVFDNIPAQLEPNANTVYHEVLIA